MADHVFRCTSVIGHILGVLARNKYKTHGESPKKVLSKNGKMTFDWFLPRVPAAPQRVYVYQLRAKSLGDTTIKHAIMRSGIEQV